MSPLVAILILALLVAVILVVAAPLRSRGSDGGAGASRADAPARASASATPADAFEAPERGELEAAREAKYREIRDSELDYRTGKLSAEDYAAVDAQLRAEAIAILNRLERLDSAPQDPGEAGAG